MKIIVRYDLWRATNLSKIFLRHQKKKKFIGGLLMNNLTEKNGLINQ